MRYVGVLLVVTVVAASSAWAQSMGPRPASELRSADAQVRPAGPAIELGAATFLHLPPNFVAKAGEADSRREVIGHGRLFAVERIAPPSIAWLKRDLARVSHSTPIVLLAHIPLWTIWEPWGWGTADSAQAMALLRPFGSVTVLNGHIHQVLQKVEGNVALHTAMSLAYPLPTPGQQGIGEPGPVTVPAGELGRLLGTRQVTVVRGRHELALIDTPLDH